MMIKKLSLLLCLFLITAGMTVHNAKAQTSDSFHAITGKTVDAETAQPLAGVRVLAMWLHGVGNNRTLLKVMETVSNAEGSYAFPAWGPVSSPAMAAFMTGEFFYISYFKNDYFPEYRSNDINWYVEYGSPTLGEFKGNGKSIKLHSRNGDVVGYTTRLTELAGSMPTRFPGGDWKKYPRMVLEIEKASLFIQKRAGVPWRARVEGFDSEKLSPEDREFIKVFANEK